MVIVYKRFKRARNFFDLFCNAGNYSLCSQVRFALMYCEGRTIGVYLERVFLSIPWNTDSWLVKERGNTVPTGRSELILVYN